MRLRYVDRIHSLLSDVQRSSTYSLVVKKYRGTRTARGITAVLNLSSGYHTPVRFLRHLIMAHNGRPNCDRRGLWSIIMEETYEAMLQRRQVKGRHQLTPCWLCDNEDSFSKCKFDYHGCEETCQPYKWQWNG